MGKTTDTCSILGGLRDGKRQLGTPRRRWGSSEMYLQRIMAAGVDWIHVAQDRDKCPALVNVLMKLRFP